MVMEGDAEPIFMAVVIAMISLLDAIIFWVTPKANFDRKFNMPKLSKKERKALKKKRPAYARPARPKTRPLSAFPKGSAAPSRQKSRPTRRTPRVNPFELRGLEKYNRQDIDGAIEDFEKALETDENNPALYFILAKCYSLKENAREAFLLLDQAVELGFDDFEQIRRDDALAFLRSRDAYEVYVKNGYRWPSDLASPKADLLSQEPPVEDTSLLLEQLKELEELYKRGVLTEEEFIQQRNRFNPG